MKVNVDGTGRVSELRRVRQLDGCVVVFKGQILGDARTFDFYNVKENDTLIVVGGGRQDAEVEKWLNITGDGDRDSVQDRFRLLFDEGTAREVARIRDVLLTKVERKPRTFRRLCGVIREVARRPSGENSVALIEGPSATNPSIEPLPVMWGDDEEVDDGFTETQEVAIDATKQDQGDLIERTVKP